MNRTRIRGDRHAGKGARSRQCPGGPSESVSESRSHVGVAIAFVPQLSVDIGFLRELNAIPAAISIATPIPTPILARLEDFAVALGKGAGRIQQLRRLW